jgi:hypothetical protein
MIELYNKITGEMETVESWPTVTPHFVITRPMRSIDPEVDLSGLVNVTHARSTAIALGPFKNLQLARYCAAVMGSLPMPWDEFSRAVSEQYPQADTKQMERFKDAWLQMPTEIHR